jgi:hypothetical protein
VHALLVAVAALLGATVLGMFGLLATWYVISGPL